MRKIIIITALCICAIAIVCIVNNTNMQESYLYLQDNKYNLEKKNISSSNQKKIKNFQIQHDSNSKEIKVNYHYKKASLKTSIKNANILSTISNNSKMPQGLSCNTPTINRRQAISENRINEYTNIETFPSTYSFNSSKENLIKADDYIHMQFAFPDEGQLNNPGETPLNNELILLIFAGLFILNKKK